MGTIRDDRAGNGGAAAWHREPGTGSLEAAQVVELVWVGLVKWLRLVFSLASSLSHLLSSLVIGDKGRPVPGFGLVAQE